jgi:transposase
MPQTNPLRNSNSIQQRQITLHQSKVLLQVKKQNTPRKIKEVPIILEKRVKLKLQLSTILLKMLRKTKKSLKMMEKAKNQ